MRLDTEISNFQGIGKARADKLQKIGIRCARDLIYFFPRTYEYRGDVTTLGSYNLEAPRSYVLTVATEVTNAKLKGHLTMSKFRAFDETGSVEVIFFNAPFVKDIFHVGAMFRFYGKPTFSKARRLNLVNPQYEPIVERIFLVRSFVYAFRYSEGGRIFIDFRFGIAFGSWRKSSMVAFCFSYASFPQCSRSFHCVSDIVADYDNHSCNFLCIRLA